MAAICSEFHRGLVAFRSKHIVSLCRAPTRLYSVAATSTRKPGTGQSRKPKANASNKQSAPSGSQIEKSDAEAMQEQMLQIDQMINMARLYPTTDPWAQEVETLDVELPYVVNPFRPTDYPSLRDMWEQFGKNTQNAAKNATSMWALANANAFPGLDLRGTKRRQKFFKWPFRVLQCRSVKPGAWIAPIRAAALDSYRELNEALAARDLKNVKAHTTSSYQDTQLKLLKRRDPNHIYKWRFHNENTPTRVLSIRAMEGYLGTEEPRIGNRMIVHALVKFDTEQSIEIYDQRGNALHSPHPGIDHTKTTRLNVPAESRRVIEYLVLEKRMWFNGPWMIKDQLWPRAGNARVAATSSFI